MVESKASSASDGHVETSMAKDGSASNPLSRKINKILESRIENDKAAVEALKELSLFFPENSLKARRNLRGQIERRSVTINQEFVAALKEVKDAVDAIYDDVKTINSQCSEMKTKLQAAKAETRHLTEQTTKLHKQRSVLEMQQEVAKAFTKAFLMTPEEVALLRSTNPTIGPAFFAALDKTQIIKNNTKHLLQTGEQTTALEVLSYSSEVREAGVSGLYHWLLNQARHTDTLSAALPTAMAYLEDRPQLFRYELVWPPPWPTWRTGLSSSGPS
ncbi:Conserved oligomeric Golgi complex subunit 6 [Trinorchestia longiramus]|nr:Conserved oligomeric Golgi complex subunit 6 [Trinorchestia longiramus]